MPSCSVNGCTNRSGRNKKVPVTFHRFPKNKNFRCKWIEALNRPDYSPSTYSVVCSEHFKEGDFDRTSQQCVRLRSGVIPSVFKTVMSPVKEEIETFAVEIEKSESPTEQLNNVPIVPISSSSTSVSTQTCLLYLPISFSSVPSTQSSLPSISSTPESVQLDSKVLKEPGNHISKKLSAYQKKVKMLLQARRRLERRNSELKNIITDLQKQVTINNDTVDVLELCSGGIPDLLRRQKAKLQNSPMPTAYSTQLKSFAMTLHYYSPLAYNYVRKVFDNCLPCPRTIIKWCTDSSLGTDVSCNGSDEGLIVESDITDDPNIVPPAIISAIKNQYEEKLEVLRQQNESLISELEKLKQELKSLQNDNQTHQTDGSKGFMEQDEKVQDFLLLKRLKELQYEERLIKEKLEGPSLNLISTEFSNEKDSFQSHIGYLTNRISKLKEKLNEISEKSGDCERQETENPGSDSHDIELLYHNKINSNEEGAVIQQKCARNDQASMTIVRKSLKEDLKINLPRRCEKCNRNFLTKRAFRIHMKLHSEKFHSCKMCNETFISASYLRQHISRLHNNVDPFECELCHMNFKLLKDLKGHLSLHNEEKIFLCDHCGMRFNRRDNLKRHTFIHTGEKPLKCHQCNKAFFRQEQLKFHMTIHTGEKPFECQQCGKKFRQKPLLIRHMQNHKDFTDDKWYHCKKCKKSYALKVNLLKHIRCCTGFSNTKHHKCEYCGKGFNLKTALKEHMNIHTGERPYKCNLCDKNFRQRCAWKQHLIVHSGEKAFVCNHCCKRFNSISNMKRHTLIHTGKKPYACEWCNKSFTRSNLLRDHIKTHTDLSLEEEYSTIVFNANLFENINEPDEQPFNENITIFTSNNI